MHSKTLVLTLISLAFAGTAFAASAPKAPRPVDPARPGVESRPHEVGRPTRPAETVAHSVDVARKAEVGTAELRIKDLTRESQLEISEFQRASVLNSLKQNESSRYAFESLFSAVKSRTQGGGRLNRNQQQLVEATLDWISAAKGDKDVSPVANLIEDAMAQNYSKELTAVMREAVSTLKEPGNSLSLKQATQEALARRGIKESDLLSCKRAA